MPGLVPSIHASKHASNKTWMAGTSPAMTVKVSASSIERARYVAFLRAKVDLMLPNSSILAPFFCMM